jgi:hypothetical protein
MVQFRFCEVVQLSSWERSFGCWEGDDVGSLATPEVALCRYKHEVSLAQMLLICYSLCEKKSTSRLLSVAWLWASEIFK